MYKYKIADAEIEVTESTNVRMWTLWDGESDIEIESGKILTLVECGKNYLADAVGTVTIE